MVTIINEKVVKIRKPHECHGCYKCIPSGSIVHRGTYSDGGEIYNIYTCEECELFKKDYWYRIKDSGGDELDRGYATAYMDLFDILDQVIAAGGYLKYKEALNGKSL